MNNRPDFMDVNEIYNWISILVLIGCSLIFTHKYDVILLFWVIRVLISGNIRRVDSDKYYTSTMILRRVGYIVPLALPIFFYSNIEFIAPKTFIWSIAGIVLGIILLIPKMSNLFIYLSNENIDMTIEREKFDYLSIIFSLIFAAIFEELFYRNFIIGFVNDGKNMQVVVVLISTYLFLMHHLGTKWSYEFKLYDFLIQVIFSIGSACIFIFSKSILPCIIAHLVYNSPHIIYNFKSYWRRRFCR